MLSEKLDIIQMVDAEPHVTCTKFAKEHCIPMLINNIMANKKKHNSATWQQPGRDLWAETGITYM
jgi:hypothetical protein